MKKQCSKCNKKLDTLFFWQKNRSLDGLDTYCKRCRKLSQKKWLNENKDKRNKTQRKWYLKNKSILLKKRKEWKKKNPDIAKDRNRKYQRRFHLKSKYGITEETFNKMFRSQQGKCAICGLNEKFLCVDHNHQTGKIRGLLCNKCNIKIGYYEEDKNFYKKATKYLSKYAKH